MPRDFDWLSDLDDVFGPDTGEPARETIRFAATEWVRQFFPPGRPTSAELQFRSRSIEGDLS